MSNPGQYPQPLLRPVVVQAPLVRGYATVRLRASLQLAGTGTNPSMNDNSVLGLFENTGLTTVAIQLQESGNLATRSVIGAPFTLVPGGQVMQTFIPKQQYVEIWTTSGGPSSVRAQLSSQLSWGQIPFSEDDTVYPPQLWQPPGY